MTTQLPIKIYKELHEIVKDSQSCSRLTDWEKTFMDQMFVAFETYEERISLSEKQQAVIHRIGRSKVYV